MDVTRILARYLVDARYEDLPAAVRHEAARALLNWLGCAVGSSRHETVERALAAVRPFSGAPQAAVLGRSDRLDILHAALLNGISSHVLDFDDTHARAIHPSAPVLPALIAYAEWRPITGKDLIHAFVLGVEAEERIGLSVFPEHYAIGWHITGTAGVFGAAAAVGRLLCLDEQQMCWALGTAATQAAGLREMFGTMCKSLHPGRAAQNGLLAALLAAKNFTSSEQAIEAPRGFGQVTSTRFDPKVITEDLGRRYELLSNMYKPYACGLVVHAAIDGCIQLTREHGITPEQIERVDLTVSPLVLELTGKRSPRSGLEGKFSVYHAAAVAIIHGAAEEAQFSDDVARDPQVIALRDRVFATEDGAIGRTEARVSIRLRDGRRLDQHVAHALGTLERPMSDADLEAKFRGLVTGILAERRIAELIAVCWSLESLDDAGDIARLATSA
ncbi:MAG: MmgE/PrpD family protein [Betaproteobacteria bacterium]|nr:MmgE/PrpD family protein [Betaproteobacteria bacterium]MDH3438592.1 MmgE/PrpD family protein [Betaproteobacteria bacterium]